MQYQAESPDEAALVAAGKAFGFFFHKRNHTSVLVREPATQGGEEAAGAGAPMHQTLCCSAGCRKPNVAGVKML